VPVEPAQGGRRTRFREVPQDAQPGAADEVADGRVAGVEEVAQHQRWAPPPPAVGGFTAEGRREILVYRATVEGEVELQRELLRGGGGDRLHHPVGGLPRLLRMRGEEVGQVRVVERDERVQEIHGRGVQPRAGPQVPVPPVVLACRPPAPQRRRDLEGRRGGEPGPGQGGDVGPDPDGAQGSTR
jgi:hypothetical protein